jgi:hypothetical protein
MPNSSHQNVPIDPPLQEGYNMRVLIRESIARNLDADLPAGRPTGIKNKRLRERAVRVVKLSR